MCEQDQLRDAIVGAGGFDLLLQLMVDTEGPMQVSAAHAVTIIVLHTSGDQHAAVKRPKRWSKRRPPQPKRRSRNPFVNLAVRWENFRCECR